MPNDNLSQESAGKSGNEVTQLQPIKLQRDFWDKLKYGAEIFGIILLAVYTGYTMKIYSTSNRSVEVASRSLNAVMSQFREDQRPWVSIADYRITQFAQGRDYIIEIQLVNAGKRPAHKVWYWNKASIAQEQGPNANNMDDGKKHATLGSISPQGPRIVRLVWKWDEWNGGYSFVVRRQFPISNYGEIVYSDDEGKEHRTQFCVFMKDAGKTNERLVSCDRFNEMN